MNYIKKYAVDPDKFKGAIITVMTDGIHCDYTRRTLQELKSIHGEGVKLLTDEELNKLINNHRRNLQKDFEEITEERFYDLLECVPPKRQRLSSFFVGECYIYDLYSFCFKKDGKYYKALRSIKLSDEELDKNRKHNNRFFEKLEKQ